MFGIGMTEMVLIAALALIILGPKKLPNDLKSTIDLEIKAEDDRHNKEVMAKNEQKIPTNADEALSRLEVEDESHTGTSSAVEEEGSVVEDPAEKLSAASDKDAEIKHNV